MRRGPPHAEASPADSGHDSATLAGTRAWAPSELTCVAIGGVVEPGADHRRPEPGLGLEAERCVEVPAIVGLQDDVLAGYLFEQVTDHCRGDASTSVGR